MVTSPVENSFMGAHIYSRTNYPQWYEPGKLNEGVFEVPSQPPSKRRKANIHCVSDGFRLSDRCAIGKTPKHA